MADTKKCAWCGRDLPLYAFYKRKYGYECACKQCRIRRNAEHFKERYDNDVMFRLRRCTYNRIYQQNHK